MECVQLMKVLLKEDVENLGYAGEVYTVANGFGRNYLIPQGFAVKADPGMMKQAAAWRKRAEARREEIRAEFEALSAKIAEVKVSFSARAGETGKLYGSITTAQLTDALNEVLGTEINRRKVGNEPLRELGEHKIVVRLNAEFQPEFMAVIESDDEMFKANVADDVVEAVETAVSTDEEE